MWKYMCPKINHVYDRSGFSTADCDTLLVSKSIIWICMKTMAKLDIWCYNNNNNARTMFMVLSSWPIVTARVHPVHLTNVGQRAGRPPTVRPSQPTWALSPPVRLIYDLHPPSPFIITQPKGWYSFYRPTEGGRLSQPRHTACIPI